ncbi:MAG TPA: amidohydrolase family protein [Gemmatimonadales bacterium]
MPRITWALSLGLSLGTAFLWIPPVHSQTPVDSALYAYIKSVRAIDNHTHAGLPILPGQPADSDFDALPVGNLPPYSFPARLTTQNPEFITAWRELYGYPYQDRTEEHVRELLALKARIRLEHGVHYAAWVLDRLGTDVALANRMSVGPGLEAPRFRWVPFADPLLYPLDSKTVAAVTPDRMDLVPRERKHIQRYLGALGLEAVPTTLAEYTRLVVTPTLERFRREGAVAIKYEIAYLRSLDFDTVSATRAAGVYDRFARSGAPSVTEYKLVQDYLFRFIAKEAGRLGLVVHLHAFDGAGGYFLAAGADPLLLEPVFTDPTLRGTRFVLVHGGWPYPRHTLSLFGKPNVYADISFLGSVNSPAITAGVLREWLTFFPDKVLFGSDAYPDTPELGWEEWGWLGATGAKRALAMALTAMLQDGEVTREGAERLATMVLRGNAEKLYGLR